jgi:hypothetical protein
MAIRRIQVRRGTATEWTGANPVLAVGEIGFEINTRKFKIGDGVGAWNALDYSAISPTDADTLFVPKTSVRISFGAGSLEPLRGTPALGIFGITWTYWLLDPTNNETVGTATELPDDWATAAVDVVWINAGTGTGDVVIRAMHDSAVPGDALLDNALLPVTVTAAGQNIVTRTHLGNLNIEAARELRAIGVERRSSDATDTLPNDIGILALVLRKVA